MLSIIHTYIYNGKAYELDVYNRHCERYSIFNGIKKKENITSTEFQIRESVFIQ